MDLLVFWENIQFTPIYKEKGMWVHRATVECGSIVQLFVIAKNRGNFLRDLEWVQIHGTSQKEKDTIQYFNAPNNINKVLSLHRDTLNERLYVHKWEKYSITVAKDPNVINMYVPDDECTLSEIVSQAPFKILRIR